MDDYVERNCIRFESKCFPIYCLHSNEAFFSFMYDFMRTTQHASMTSNALRRAVQSQTIAWLLRNNGHIQFQEKNTWQSRTHTCRISEFIFFERVQLIVGIIIRTLKDGYSPHQSIDSYQHFFVPDEPFFSNRLFLSISCRPNITVVKNQHYWDCLQFTYGKKPSPPRPPSKAHSIVSSWFFRTGVPIVCKQVPQEMIVDYYVEDSKDKSTDSEFCFPLSLNLYVSKLVASFSTEHITPKSQDNSQPLDHTIPYNNYTDDDNRTKQTTPKSRQRKQQYPKKSSVQYSTHSYSTRYRNAIISQFLQSTSHSKEEIQYPDRRHQPGDPPNLTTPARCSLRITPVEETVRQQRISELSQMMSFHAELKEKGIFAPRDKWTAWLQFTDDPTADRPFMILITICMSSSTSDSQLSSIIPRLFACGLTSANAVIDIAQQFGMNAFCSLLSESGLYYNNTERIVNAADYFCQYHGGKIPEDITIYELTKLHGIGYKTACIVIEEAFHRVDGIPADIHVIRWADHLSWTPTGIVGIACSKVLESWLPQDKWYAINPLFGAFGQHCSTIDSKSKIIAALTKTDRVSDPVRKKIMTMIHKY